MGLSTVVLFDCVLVRSVSQSARLVRPATAQASDCTIAPYRVLAMRIAVYSQVPIHTVKQFRVITIGGGDVAT